MRRNGLAKAVLVGAGSVGAALVVAAGCSASAPSAEEINTQFTEFLADKQTCEVTEEGVDTDCTVIIAGCPLGTFVAVNRKNALEVDEKARQLLRRFAQEDQVCANPTDETAPLGAHCVEGLCQPLDGEPPKGNGDDEKDAGQAGD